uniref:BTB domain-containing protein n=1 Tax=Chromera velia CCMP2878 TaxID=1169474 RepID=A0A0G4HK58_9ALVE|eukprot:Cvel_28350.t1-p1 / transcript=Cvel_28350.t1 / gene=Cvel_28350 / organism=Chromera_velia_CCMP2878 / gene_product=hypothetical protein / transcript_product=hypothetical protein / location=Cvel_scaffold3690:8454-9245(+) / protein_length=264 / sequence_SO=supercontig / SO=protein_coding / is_pseudo=false
MGQVCEPPCAPRPLKEVKSNFSVEGMSHSCECACVSIALRDFEETVVCRRALLVKHSEYFRAMLEGGHFREGTAPGKAIKITEEWLQPETFKHLNALMALSEITSPSCPLPIDDHLKGVCTKACTLDNPNGPFALLKMCDYFQMDEHVGAILRNLYDTLDYWPLEAVRVLHELKPGILDSADFPFDKVAAKLLPKMGEKGTEEKLSSFPPKFLARLLKKQHDLSAQSATAVDDRVRGHIRGRPHASCLSGRRCDCCEYIAKLKV